MNKVFKALSDPTRRKVLELLRRQPLTAGDIAAHFVVSKPTMSAHFAVLREADLIEAEKVGREIIYRLKMSVLEEALLSFAQAFGWELLPRARRAARGQIPERRDLDMKRHLMQAQLIAGLIVAGAVALSYLAGHGFIAHDKREISTRGYNLTVALILVWWANLAPKRLRPLAEIRGNPATEQSVRHFTGIAIVIGGLLSALVWLVAPFNLALPLEALAMGGAVIIVLLHRYRERMRSG